MVRKLVLSLVAVLGMSFMALAQNQQVSGTVTDSHGVPVVGATVMVDGTNQGTTTGADGKFAVSAPANGSLTVSFVGFETYTVQIAGKSNVNVSLKEDMQAIDNVIVVAYGTAKKESFTGSVSTVSGETLKKMQVSNVSKALEGMVPGMQVASQSGQPGSSAEISIRGIGSINAGSSPLYIVDGAPYSGSIAAINPADIESISVSKDAVSTALYGSRAANGLIIITTKKGSAMRNQVSFDARIGVNSRGISNYDIMDTPTEYLSTYFQYLVNTEGSGQAASDMLLARLGYNPFLGNNGVVMTPDGQFVSTERRYRDVWEDEVFANGMRQEYNVSLSGGTQKMKHYMSVGYLNDEGILPKSDYNRYSARANATYQINDYIDLFGNLSYSHGEQNSQNIESLGNYSNSFMFVQQIAPIYPVYAYDEEGQLIRDANGKRQYDFGDGEFGETRTWGKSQNPAATDEANLNQTLTDQVSARMGINISPIAGLKISANVAYDMVNQAAATFMTPSFGDAVTYNGTGDRTHQRNFSLTSNQLISYAKTISGHNFSVMAGHESYKWKSRYFSATKRNFYDPENPEFNNAISMQDITSYTNEETIESFFGSLHYEYDNRYYLDANVRTDGSSRFHKDNRWGTFWSVGANWRLSQEDFLKDVDWITNLAVKASYGTTGNNSIGNYYAYQDQYSVSPDGDNFAVKQVYWGNKDLTWEMTTNLNFGISASFFDARLKFDAEWYDKNTEDMLYSMPYPPSSGITSVPMNIMTMNNTGMEFTLAGKPIKTKDMQLEVVLTGSFYENSVTDLPEAKREDGITHNAYYCIKDGGRVWDFYYLKSAGVDPINGDRLYWHRETDADGNETLKAVVYDEVDTTKDKFYLGTAKPDFLGGVTVNFDWKNLDFSIAGSYQLGGKVLDGMYQSLMHTGKTAGANWHRDIKNAWTPENTDTNIPKLNGHMGQNQCIDPFLVDGSYFSIRNITLGYTLPQKWTKALKMSSVRVYLTADNVAIFSKRKGLDPRQYIQGASDANYSVLRTVSGGVSINF